MLQVVVTVVLSLVFFSHQNPYPFHRQLQFQHPLRTALLYCYRQTPLRNNAIRPHGSGFSYQQTQPTPCPEKESPVCVCVRTSKKTETTPQGLFVLFALGLFFYFSERSPIYLENVLSGVLFSRKGFDATPGGIHKDTLLLLGDKDKTDTNCIPHFTSQTFSDRTPVCCCRCRFR